MILDRPPLEGSTTMTGGDHSDTGILPYRVEVPQADLDDLQRRLAQTR
jgi:hypothetical protein